MRIVLNTKNNNEVIDKKKDTNLQISTVFTVYN